MNRCTTTCSSGMAVYVRPHAWHKCTQMPLAHGDVARNNSEMFSEAAPATSSSHGINWQNQKYPATYLVLVIRTSTQALKDNTRSCWAAASPNRSLFSHFRNVLQHVQGLVPAEHSWITAIVHYIWATVCNTIQAGEHIASHAAQAILPTDS